MNGMWQGGSYVLQSTIEERYAKVCAQRDQIRDALQMLYDTHYAPYGGEKAAMYPIALELTEKALREAEG